MVAVDEHGKSVLVPALNIDTPLERKRWAAAQLRREYRKEVEQRSLEIRQKPEDLLGA